MLLRVSEVVSRTAVFSTTFENFEIGENQWASDTVVSLLFLRKRELSPSL